MNATFARTATAAAVAVLTSNWACAATINLVDLGGVTGSPAEQGFQIAAGFWGGLLTNNVTINLGVGFAALAPNVIGQTGSRSADLSVATWQAGIGATKSLSTIDQTLVLPTLTGGGVSGLTTGYDSIANTNDVTLTQQLNGFRASEVLWANSAVIKAVGAPLVNPGLRDGDVTFSTNFPFDFNPSDGVSAGTMDFIGVAIHEIGHALGFVSGVDFFDVFSAPNGPGNGVLGYDLNDTSIFSALDMFRYGAPGVLDLRVDQPAYFSIDGGVSALMANEFATGRFNGDGDQASHWKDANGCSGQLGIMDPTFCFAQMGEITGLDLAAFDAMGWNLSVDALNFRTMTSADIYNAAVGNVPEPATWALMLSAMGLAGVARKRTASSGPRPASLDQA